LGETLRCLARFFVVNNPRSPAKTQAGILWLRLTSVLLVDYNFFSSG
jgi:hypothetical protein